MPAEDAAGLTAQQERLYPPQYLVSELANRVAKGPVSWQLVLQMAQSGDPTDDVTEQWPDDRPQIVAGTLVLDRLHEDPALLEGLVFDPTHVPPGIEISDDPILHFRSAAYTESHRRRSGESKPEVTPK